MAIILDNDPERRPLATVTPFTQWRSEPGAAYTSRVYTLAPNAPALIDGGRYELEEDGGTRHWARFKPGANEGWVMLWKPLPSLPFPAS